MRLAGLESDTIHTRVRNAKSMREPNARAGATFFLRGAAFVLLSLVLVSRKKAGSIGKPCTPFQHAHRPCASYHVHGTCPIVRGSLRHRRRECPTFTRRGRRKNRGGHGRPGRPLAPDLRPIKSLIPNTHLSTVVALLVCSVNIILIHK